LIKEKVTLTVGRVPYSDKVEKFFDIFEKKVKFFSSVDALVHKASRSV
jgi:hypothetical protein